MPTSTYLSNPVVTVNAVDLTDQVSASTLTLTAYNSFAATETYATLSALVGTSTTVKIKPTSAAASATNPESTLTGCYLETLPIVNAALGALDTIDITFTGGVYTVSAP